MVGYFEQIDRHIETSGTVTLKGIPLDIGSEHPLKTKGYFPVLSPTCVCITDPCPCDDDEGVIVWLPEAAIRSRNPTEEKTSRGEALTEYRLTHDADLITETFAKTKAGAFGRRAAHSVPSNLQFPGTRFTPPTSIGTRSTLASRSVTCAGNTLYYVVEGPDGSGGTLFEYIPIGSCQQVAS